MYFDFKVPVPDAKSKIFFKVIKGVTYVNFEYDRIYKPDKKYNIPKRTTIGKLCDEDPSMMYPNPNFLKYFPDVQLPVDQGKDVRSSCLRTGAYIVLSKLIEETMLDKLIGVMYSWDSKGIGLFFDLVLYSLITENNAAQYYGDYAYNHPLFTPNNRIYSDSTISEFLRQIDMDDVVQFQNSWNSSKDHRQKIYISYDSTNKNFQAGDIDIVEYGHPKDNKGLPIFNFSVAYDTNNREPLFYEEYPGSVVDIVQLQFMLEKAKGYGYRNAGFILDRGYFSEENIHYMDKHNYEFVIMVKGMKELVSASVLDVKNTFEEKRGCFIQGFGVNGTTIRKKVWPQDQKDRYLHVYYSPSKCAAERTALETKLEKMKRYLKAFEDKKEGALPNRSVEQYFRLEIHHEGQPDAKYLCAQEKEEVIEREMKLCGYFCILTSEKMTAKEALQLYKSRDGSEKLFRADKTFLGNHCMRVGSEEALTGKILIEFVALILRNRFYTNLKDEAEKMESIPNYMNVPAALKELEKIEMIRQGDGVYRLDHAVTKNQKIILKAFGMDANDIKKQAKKISETLIPRKTGTK